jgi:hypothetical protein
MFAASVEYLVNNLLSRIRLPRFFKHNKLKMSKIHFFSNGTPYLLLNFFDKLVFSGKVAPHLVILG